MMKLQSIWELKAQKIHLLLWQPREDAKYPPLLSSHRVLSSRKKMIGSAQHVVSVVWFACFHLVAYIYIIFFRVWK
jgi:hypothetical protein